MDYGDINNLKQLKQDTIWGRVSPGLPMQMSVSCLHSCHLLCAHVCIFCVCAAHICCARVLCDVTAA